jgi:hypothetical protein
MTRTPFPNYDPLFTRPHDLAKEKSLCLIPSLVRCFYYSLVFGFLFLIHSAQWLQAIEEGVVARGFKLSQSLCGEASANIAKRRH